MHSPSVAVLSDAEFEILEGTSRALGAVPAAIATEREGSPYQVQSGLSGTIAKLFRNRCQEVANAQSVGSVFFVRSNLAVTSGGNIGSTNPQLCVESGGRLFHVRSSFLNDSVAPGLSIAFLDLSNNESLSFSTESTGQLAATQANATVQNRNGSATGLATANTNGPQYILINAFNAVSTFLSDKGGITLYPIGLGFPQPTSVKGVYVAGSSVDPRFLTSRFFSPFDGLRITNHLPLLNPIAISSPLSGATFYGNQIIQATANQSVTWQINGVAFSGNSFPASLLSTGRNVLTAVGAESESSIVLNRSAAAGTAFLPEPPPSILLSVGTNFTTLDLRFYSLEFGIGNVKLFLKNLTLNEEREISFTVESGSFQSPTGNAAINLLPGQYSLQIKSADGSQLIVQRDLQVSASGPPSATLILDPDRTIMASPANVTIRGASFNTPGIKLTSQLGDQPEVVILTPTPQQLADFSLSRTYNSSEYLRLQFRVRSLENDQIITAKSFLLMPTSKISISPSSASWESDSANCGRFPENLNVSIFVTNSLSRNSYISNFNFPASITGFQSMDVGRYVGRLNSNGLSSYQNRVLVLREAPGVQPSPLTQLPLNVSSVAITVNGQPMWRCSYNTNSQ